MTNEIAKGTVAVDEALLNDVVRGLEWGLEGRRRILTMRVGGLVGELKEEGRWPAMREALDSIPVIRALSLESVPEAPGLVEDWQEYVADLRLIQGRLLDAGFEDASYDYWNFQIAALDIRDTVAVLESLRAVLAQQPRGEG